MGWGGVGWGGGWGVGGGVGWGGVGWGGGGGGGGGMLSFSYRSEFYTHDHKGHYCELEWSSNYQHPIHVDVWKSFWDINNYMTKSCLSWKSGKTSYSGEGQKLGRPVIHTYHIHMNEHIFVWMLIAQMIRNWNIEMEFRGCTSSSGAF